MDLPRLGAVLPYMLTPNVLGAQTCDLSCVSSMHDFDMALLLNLPLVFVVVCPNLNELFTGTAGVKAQPLNSTRQVRCRNSQAERSLRCHLVSREL